MGILTPWIFCGSFDPYTIRSHEVSLFLVQLSPATNFIRYGPILRRKSKFAPTIPESSVEHEP